MSVLSWTVYERNQTFAYREKIPKKITGIETPEMKYWFIFRQLVIFPITLICTAMSVIFQPTMSGKRPTKMITATELHFYGHLKALFEKSNGLNNRERSKKLREQCFYIGRYRTRTLMHRINLKVLRLSGHD